MKASKYLYWIPVLLLCCFYVYKAARFPANDFANYYFAGKFLADGKFNPSVYFPYEFNKAIAGLGYREIFVSYAPNTPFLAVLFMPFSFLSLATAKISFNCLSVLLFLFSLRRIALRYKIHGLYVLLVAVLFFVPIKNELLFGQVYFLLFFLLAESWLAYEKQFFFKMAIFLAFAILLKVFPAVLILVLVFRKQFLPLIYLCLCGLVLMAFSMFFTGTGIWEFYLTSVLPKAANGEIAGEYVANYQSVFMFLKQLLVYDKTLNPNGFDLPVLFSALMLAFKIKLIAVGFYITKKANHSLFVLSYWVLAMVLLSPYGSTYTFILLVFSFFALVSGSFSGVTKIAGSILLVAVNNIPVHFILSLPFPFSYLRLLVLLLFFILLTCLVFACLNLKSIAAIVLLPFALLLFHKKEQPLKLDYVLDENAPILVYDYTVSQNLLVYFYWTEKGSQSDSITVDGKKAVAAAIKDDQVFYDGRQLTHSPDHKCRPVVVDGHVLLYLSDAGRGIGFYTIRSIGLK